MLQEVWNGVHKNLEETSGHMQLRSCKRSTVSEPFEVGQKVYLPTKNLKLKFPSVKLAPHFIGPFAIMRVIYPLAYELDLPCSCA
ncbi:hypothetical protein GDO78_018156 [Eleutherodactylus coqui]|uniref:Tf2-1-like SH3-like domain-containing protein n=1 Tax=Eleutherodactylus coqui TaxID=57060 RepID=A0A8J6BKQ2_ELECQ|nr:hypothetical protein GDO78_018156 [Eleutherodactylus coqui]